MAILAERLKARRLVKGWTQKELAERSGVPQQTISHYERNGMQPTVVPVQKLAYALECTPDYLMGNTDEPRQTIAESGLNEFERWVIARLRRAEDRNLINALIDREIEKRVGQLRSAENIEDNPAAIESDDELGIA